MMGSFVSFLTKPLRGLCKRNSIIIEEPSSLPAKNKACSFFDRYSIEREPNLETGSDESVSEKQKREGRKKKKTGSNLCGICYCDYKLVPKCLKWRPSEEFRLFSIAAQSQPLYLLRRIFYDYVTAEDINNTRIVLHQTRRQTHTACLECGLNWLIEELSYRDRYKVVKDDIEILKCVNKAAQAVMKKREKVLQPCSKKVSLAFILKQLPPINLSFLDEEKQKQVCKLIRSGVKESENKTVKEILEGFLERKQRLRNPYVAECYDNGCSGFLIINFSSRTMECDKCKEIWCRRCKTVDHGEEKSCEELQLSRYDEETKTYYRNQIDANLMCFCPNCSTVIEKDGGCNHMACEGCRAHICWKCKECFETATECYDHLSDKELPCYGIF